MRKLILLLFLITPLFTVAQQQFLIKGKIKNVQAPAKIFLDYWRPGGKAHWDSTIVKNSEFEFRGSIADTAMATIFVDYKGISLDDIWKKDNVDQKDFYLTVGTTFLTGNDSAGNAKLSGTKINLEYDKYCKLLKVARDKLDIAKTDEESSRANSKMLDVDRDFIKKNPASYISLNKALIDFGTADLAEAEHLFMLLDESVRLTKMGISYGKYLNALKLVINGSAAPDFALPDTNGNMMKLSSFRGKYVLVDFWASWCVPCRHANPGVVKAFDKYKGKNFTVLGVSLDKPTSKDAWVAAIHKDGLNWPQVLDQDKEIVKLYAVIGIPYNFLIDPDGKIIAQNLGTENLESKLAEVLDHKVSD